LFREAARGAGGLEVGADIALFSGMLNSSSSPRSVATKKHLKRAVLFDNARIRQPSQTAR
jgi:hypothetical protein